MTDTNWIGGLVKVLEIPKQKIINTNIYLTYFRVQFPQVRNNSIVTLKFWGNLAQDIATYYKINDYILIEGYLSLRTKAIQKKIDITVLKIYPFLLSYDPSKIKSF